MSEPESLKINFPSPIIPRNSGLLSYEMINEVHSKGKLNTASVASELGGEVYGILALTLPPATYL